jgi:hypothetical protein
MIFLSTPLFTYLRVYVYGIAYIPSILLSKIPLHKMHLILKKCNDKICYHNMCKLKNSFQYLIYALSDYLTIQVLIHVLYMIKSCDARCQ